jgi:hypothetical protein
MLTKRQLSNLKRGGVAATPESAEHAPLAKLAQQKELEQLGDLANVDPWAAYGEMHRVMVLHIAKLLKDEQRSKEKPHRETTNRLRELRQLTEALSLYRRSREGEMQGAEEFFTTLAARLPNLQELASNTRPVAKAP